MAEIPDVPVPPAPTPQTTTVFKQLFDADTLAAFIYPGSGLMVLPVLIGGRPAMIEDQVIVIPPPPPPVIK